LLTDALEHRDVVGIGSPARYAQIKAVKQIGPEVEHAVSVS
jgi:hypothetical protein